MKLTFEVIDAVTVSGKTTSNSQQNGIKRYFPINIYFLIFFFYLYSIALQTVKRKCNSAGTRCHYPSTTSNTRKRKRSIVTTPPPETLYDESWGVSISIFLIFLMKFSIFFFLISRCFGWV